jgi:hypothetical protein
MKTIFCILFIAGSVTLVRAQNSSCATANCQPASACAPVVCQSRVVYSAPVVVYRAPAYCSPRGHYVRTRCAPACPGASTVIHITSHGTYSYSTYGHRGSTVVHIGTQYARR